jgi:hypothetical protein
MHSGGFRLFSVALRNVALRNGRSVMAASKQASVSLTQQIGRNGHIPKLAPGRRDLSGGQASDGRRIALEAHSAAEQGQWCGVVWYGVLAGHMRGAGANRLVWCANAQSALRRRTIRSLDMTTIRGLWRRAQVEAARHCRFGGI